MNLRELRTAIDSIATDYDNDDVVTLDTAFHNEVMIGVVPNMTARRLTSTKISGVLFIERLTEE